MQSGTLTSAADQRTDDQITAAFIARKASGLDDAYRSYGRVLYSVARSVLLNDDDAQDCVHDTLLRVWQRTETFRSERGTLRSYLLTCVRNDAITRKRNSQRHLRIETDLARSNPFAYSIESDDVIERERLRDAVLALPMEQRTALSLAYYSHLTHSEIAERLGEPLGTIKGRLRLALARLQRALAASAG